MYPEHNKQRGSALVIAVFIIVVMLALVLTVTATGAMAIARMTGRLQPAVAGNGSSRNGDRSSAKRDYRVWNDGRGTIIDM